MRVLIAEDSVLLRQGLVHLLTDAGFDVVAAVGGRFDVTGEAGQGSRLRALLPCG